VCHDDIDVVAHVFQILDPMNAGAASVCVGDKLRRGPSRSGLNRVHTIRPAANGDNRIATERSAEIQHARARTDDRAQRLSVGVLHRFERASYPITRFHGQWKPGPS
jgi:hypothetical protein